MCSVIPDLENRSAGGTDTAVGVPSVERALDILELLATTPGRLTLSDIAVRLSVPKGSAHRLLTTLSARGYVASGENGRSGYTLGPRLRTLAGPRQGQPDLIEAAREPLRALATATGEGCQLSIRAGDQVLCLFRVPSPSHPEVALMGGVGASFPLHAVAVGKALLAFAPREERARYLQGERLESFTPATLTEPERLTQELETIRATGIARDEQEYKRGLRAFAAPVFGPEGGAVAAIALPMLVGAVPVEDTATEQQFIQALRDAAADISRSLGGSI